MQSTNGHTACIFSRSWLIFRRQGCHTYGDNVMILCLSKQAEWYFLELTSLSEHYAKAKRDFSDAKNAKH